MALFFVSPMAKNTDQFFNAVNHKKTPNSLMLMGSLVISWIFAKSITNAANLGLEFGLVGGMAYAAYYLSFAVAGIIIYRMRKLGGLYQHPSFSDLSVRERGSCPIFRFDHHSPVQRNLE